MHSAKSSNDKNFKVVQFVSNPYEMDEVTQLAAVKVANYRNGVWRGRIARAKSTWSIGAAGKLWKLSRAFLK